LNPPPPQPPPPPNQTPPPPPQQVLDVQYLWLNRPMSIIRKFLPPSNNIPDPLRFLARSRTAFLYSRISSFSPIGCQTGCSLCRPCFFWPPSLRPNVCQIANQRVTFSLFPFPKCYRWLTQRRPAFFSFLNSIPWGPQGSLSELFQTPHPRTPSFSVARLLVSPYGLLTQSSHFHRGHDLHVHTHNLTLSAFALYNCLHKYGA